MATEIKYKGNTIALEVGDTVALHTGGMRLTEDIVITADEQGGSGEEWIGDGKTHLWIKIAAEGRMDVPLCFSQTVANGVSIDWGDGSTPQTISDTGVAKITHTYASIGKYCITLDAVDGCTLGLGDDNGDYCVMGYNENPVYCNMLQKAEIGNSVTRIGVAAFYNCYSLTKITISNSVTSIGRWSFNNCYSLTNITIPNSVASMEDSVFSDSHSLTNITIPDSVTSIGTYAFCDCYSLTNITIPGSVTSIGTYAFNNCYSLTNITIPGSVASIGSKAISNCKGLGKVRFDGTTPPTINRSDAFSSLSTDCIISVPVGCLDAYKAAANYPDPMVYTYIEE